MLGIGTPNISSSEVEEVRPHLGCVVLDSHVVYVPAFGWQRKSASICRYGSNSICDYLISLLQESKSIQAQRMGMSCSLPNCQWTLRPIRRRSLHPFLVVDYFRECNTNGVDEFQCVALEIAIVSRGLTIDVPIIQPYVRSLIFDFFDLNSSLLA